ncbi:MAG: hypothetical protein M1838_005263 [Thelocarpon superellum]|nr:MAG: hypothetical protein M1838_005263 [Thelocarpon superellum]
MGLFGDWLASIDVAAVGNIQASTKSLAVLVTIGLVLLTAWLRGSPGLDAKRGHDGAEDVPMLPTWLPGLGHLLSLIYDQDGFLRKARDDTVHGAFGLNLGGMPHSMVFSPALIKGVLQQRASVVDFESIMWMISQRFFGGQSRVKDKILAAYPPQLDLIGAAFLRPPGLTRMVATTVARMEENIPNMLSFMASPVDQSPWERISRPALRKNADGQAVMEVDLCALLREFMGCMATPTLMGQTFLDNFPNVLQDLYTFDAGFYWLLTGLPRWLPIPPLTRAHLARKRVLNAVTAYDRAMDQIAGGEEPDSIWRNMMGDISDFMTQRQAIWRSHGLSAEDRAHSDMSFLWAMNVNANVLCVWMILRILSTPHLVQRVRVETAPYVVVTHDPPIHGMSSPPRVTISDEGLATKCPLFKACYLETLRLDSAPWSIKHVTKDFTITENEGEVRRSPTFTGAPLSSKKLEAEAEKKRGGEREKAKSYVIKAATNVLIPHDLLQSDMRYYAEPEEFQPQRFLVFAEAAVSSASTSASTLPPLSSTSASSTTDPSDAQDANIKVDAGHLRPYGGGTSMCLGRRFAERECLAFVAGVLALWDIVPAGTRGGEGDWTLPRKKRATAVALPIGDVRVWIRRRK